MTSTVAFICDSATAGRLDFIKKGYVVSGDTVERSNQDIASISSELGIPSDARSLGYPVPTQCSALRVGRDHSGLRGAFEIQTFTAFHTSYSEFSDAPYVLFHDPSYDDTIVGQRRNGLSYPLWGLLNSLYHDTYPISYGGFIGFVGLSLANSITPKRAVRPGIFRMSYDSLPADVNGSWFLKSDRFHRLRLPIGAGYIFQRENEPS
jgi:hypothetical protein